MNSVIDAYLKWERELRDLGGALARDVRSDGQEPETEPTWFSPTLVELHKTAPKGGGTLTYAATVEKLLGRSDSPGNDRILIDHAERQLLWILLRYEGSFPDGESEYAILYRPEESDPDDTSQRDEDVPLFTEIKRGPPVSIYTIQFKPARDLQVQAVEARDAGASFMGVIDDGLPFLNRTFATRDKTRIAAVWLQSIANPGQGQDEELAFGKVLLDEDIDKWASLDEAHVYRKINSEAYQITDLKAVQNAVSHGSHVMSIAAGSYADAGRGTATDAADHILGVQLEPRTVLDTSGRRLRFAVVHGVRWMIAVALTKALQEPYRYAPLVINLSYGAAAGPKDGTGFLETALRAEIARYERWTQIILGRVSPLRVVLPFGNGFRDKLVAAQPVAPDQPVHLNWRVLPDDRTASYLEVRVSEGAGERLYLQPPTEQHPLEIQLAPGASQDYCVEDETLARVFREPNQHDGTAHYVIATRPTRFFRGRNRPAPSGSWKVGVRVEHRARVSLQVQRDDTPFSYRPNGRQSYLDHPEGYAWDPELRSYSKPSRNCPITREGTHIDTASPEHRGAYDQGIYWAGGVFRHHIDPKCLPVARYSAAGSINPPWANAERPTASLPSDTSHGQPGMLAAGTLTGSVAVLNGTSIAAPQFARLVLQVLRDKGPFKDIGQELAAIFGTADRCNADNGRRGLATLPARGVIPRAARDRV